MQITAIDNLEEWKKHGIQYRGIEKKVEANATLSATKAYYEYFRAYRYDLKLQGLTELEVTNIISSISAMQKAEAYAEIDLTQFDGYINFGGSVKGIEIESADISLSYEELETYGLSIPLMVVMSPETL